MAAYREFPERFQVAFSFAGAQRDIVRAVAEHVEHLLDRGSVFFDEWFEYYIAGDDADLRLQDIYQKRAELVVVCVSSAYNDRPWTQLEHRAIRALTMSLGRMSQESLRLLPIRVGDGDVEGIHFNAIVPDVRGRSPDAIAQLIAARLEHVRKGPLGSRPIPVHSRPTPAERSVDALISDLCSNDPSVAMPAARDLATRDHVVQLILDRPGQSMEPIPLAAVRLALRNNREAALALASRVLEGDSRWHVARQAAHDLDPSHAPFCEDELGAAFARSGRDGQRVLCYALGNLGANKWGWQILERLSNVAESRELMAFALDGFSEMFRLARGEDVRRVSEMLRQALRIDEEREVDGLSPHSMRYTLGHLTGDHVDTILKEWLTSASYRIRILGIQSLGDARIRRAIPALEAALHDSNDRVRTAASQALGNICTPEATEALMRSGRETVGIALCLHMIVDESDFRTEVQRVLSTEGPFRWAAVRAVGLRRAAEFLVPLRKLLHGSDELERGCALLALARLGGPEDRGHIESGMREASGVAFEQVMSMLAFITIHPDRYDQVDMALRASLASQSYSFWYLAQRDIIDVLESTEHPQALHVARSWRPFYAGIAGA
jgi:hypothetical protein